MAAARYVLTRRAADDLREARTWSLARWGKGSTEVYSTGARRNSLISREKEDSREAKSRGYRPKPIAWRERIARKIDRAKVFRA